MHTPSSECAKAIMLRRGDIYVKPISKQAAKKITVQNHYMKTWPQGSQIYFGVFTNGVLSGAVVFGKTSAMEAKGKKIGYVGGGLIEMQRMWISDRLGHNAESLSLSMIIKQIKENTDIRLIITHAGGCKNDCGIVYQASAWLYFGSQKCEDFFLLRSGEYKNIAAAMRFGRVSAKGKTKQQIGVELFGNGKIVVSKRHLYAYPLKKSLRRILSRSSIKEFPKDSSNFRRGQKWI